MRIDNSLATGSSQQVDSNNGLQNARDTQVKNSGSSPTDSLVLSFGAQKISDLKTAAMQLPEVRQDKVDYLQKQVSSGVYHPTLKEVTKAVLDDLMGIKG